MTTLVDTNVLIYDSIENSPHHDRASKIIDESEDPLINSLSIIELGFVLPRYGIGNDDVYTKIEELLHSGYFLISWISGSILEGASEFMVENNLSFKDLNDWIIAYDAHSRRVPLATFDRTLSRKCQKLGIQVIEA